MMTNIKLSQQLKRFVEERVQKGRFNSATDVVRAGLKLLEQEEKRNRFTFSTREDLEQKLLEGRDSGQPIRLTKKDWKALHDRLREYVNANQP